MMIEHNAAHVASVHIDKPALDKACKLAKVTHKAFRNKPGHYPNEFNSHLLGKIGEIACVQWLEEHGFKCHAAFEKMDEIRGADVIVGNGVKFRIDVKTWSKRFWSEMGRCVAVNQLKALKIKADAIIWCIAPDKINAPMYVNIAGWNIIEDIDNAPQRLTGLEGKRKVNNYQLDPDKLRPLIDLINRLQR